MRASRAGNNRTPSFSVFWGRFCCGGTPVPTYSIILLRTFSVAVFTTYSIPLWQTNLGYSNALPLRKIPHQIELMPPLLIIRNPSIKLQLMQPFNSLRWHATLHSFTCAQIAWPCLQAAQHCRNGNPIVLWWSSGAHSGFAKPAARCIHRQFIWWRGVLM